MRPGPAVLLTLSATLIGRCVGNDVPIGGSKSRYGQPASQQGGSCKQWGTVSSFPSDTEARASGTSGWGDQSVNGRQFGEEWNTTSGKGKTWVGGREFPWRGVGVSGSDVSGCMLGKA
ncbi:hypothetical protein E2C01_098575 [Portunus trituberculatus]|uniref:Secreted protein n=1 Tax=Portunus trituberculatus TaxID=210409 RepID=A0A5B7K811_PORTR|nr:hypothetical protein [Portunus trituberculatus]